MPTYEYECEKCGHRFEKFQTMRDEPLTTCPKCDGQLKRLFGTGGGVLIKGNVRYSTDSKQQNIAQTRCGNKVPCCGRDVPCEKPPCTK